MNITTRVAFATLCAAVAVSPCGLAQTSTCDTACAALPFSPAQRTVVQTAGGCHALVTWRLRIGCRGLIDIAVESVRPLEDDCGVLRLPELLWSSIDALLRQTRDPIPFPTNRDTCLGIYRVMFGTCWRFDDRCGDSVAVPCDTSACCVTRYTICRDSNKVLRPVRGPSSQVRLCDTNQWCTPVCPGGVQGRPPVEDGARKETSGGSLSATTQDPPSSAGRPASAALRSRSSTQRDARSPSPWRRTAARSAARH